MAKEKISHIYVPEDLAKGLNRRQFLKSLGLAGVAVTIGSPIDKASAFISPDTNQFWSTCGICGSCGVILTVKEGKITSIQGDPDSGSKGFICNRGIMATKIHESPKRLTHPLKKTAGGLYEKISWDEALDRIADKFNQIKANYGPQAVYFCAGMGAKDVVALTWSVWPILLRLANAFGTPNYDDCCSVCWAATVVGNKLTYGADPYADYKNANCIVLWGKNPYSSSILSWLNKICPAKDRGAKLIVVDPVRIVPAEIADIHAQVRPGSDGALALGMINVIVENGLYDTDFVANWTVGFEGLCKILPDYTPEKVEEITGVPAATIREMAWMYATNSPACIAMGNAPELQTNGCYCVRAVAVLQAICGNFDVSGGAMLGGQKGPFADMSLNELKPSTPPIGEERFPLYTKYMNQGIYNRLPEAILDGDPYPIKGVFSIGFNPVLTAPNALKHMESFKKLEMFAVVDIFMTETAKLADIVLPGAYWMERSNLTSRISLTQKAVEPPGECKTDWEIIVELARKMGLRDQFPWNSYEDCVAEYIAPAGLTIEDLKTNKYPKVPYTSHAHQSYLTDGFNTPSGKVEIYSQEMEDCGYEPYPVYIEPSESPLKPIAALYPINITTGYRIKEYYQSQLRNILSYRRKYPLPLIEINVNTASRLGVINGDKVTVESPRGKIQLWVKITDRLKDNVASLAAGWTEASANILTSNTDLDPVTGYPNFRGFMCRITKV
jgi:anaerobic selenocysteine-containing dehydrogenase